MSRLCRQCGILNISKPYTPPRPVTGTALLRRINTAGIFNMNHIKNANWSNSTFDYRPKGRNRKVGNREDGKINRSKLSIRRDEGALKIAVRNVNEGISRSTDLTEKLNNSSRLRNSQPFMKLKCTSKRSKQPATESHHGFITSNPLLRGFNLKRQISINYPSFTKLLERTKCCIYCRITD
jgi:hypothetical protein